MLMTLPGSGTAAEAVLHGPPYEPTMSERVFAESLSAVLAETGAERVAIVAMGAAGMIACHFAVRSRGRK